MGRVGTRGHPQMISGVWEKLWTSLHRRRGTEPREGRPASLGVALGTTPLGWRQVGLLCRQGGQHGPRPAAAHRGLSLTLPGEDPSKQYPTGLAQ